MTTFSKDSIADQIIRGEIFYATYSATITPGVAETYTVEVGASDLSVKMESSADEQLLMILSRNGTASGGTVVPSYNLNFSSADTVDAVVKRGSSMAGAVDSLIYNSWDGDFGKVTPFAYDTGLVLTANTDYHFNITTYGANPTSYTIAMFLREV